MTVAEQVVRTDPTKQIASRVVNECLRVKPGEQVAVFTWDHTVEEAAALALEVEKASAVSTTILLPNEFYWSYLKSVPEEQFARPQKGLLAMLDGTDAMINLGGPKDPSEYTRLPGERLAKQIDGQQPMVDKTIARKIRNIFLPFGLVTRERAKQYEFDYNNWTRITNNSLNVDHNKITALGRKLADKIHPGKDVRVTAQNGTNLRFKLKGRPVHVRDGILDPQDIAEGTQFESLPAGVLETAVDEHSAEGVIRFDQPTALAGKMLSGLKWEFKNGHLSYYDAMMNVESFKKLYEPAQGDKDLIASLAIGLNPGAETIGFFTDRIVQGTVSIAIGGNSGMGGDNKTIFGNEGTLKKPTLEIDGVKLISDGKFQL